MQKIDYLEADYEYVAELAKLLKPNKMVWFISSYQKNPDDDKLNLVLFGIDATGNIVVVDSQKEIKKAAYILENTTLDVTVDIEYIYLGPLKLRKQGSPYFLGFKKSGYAFRHLTKHQLLLMQYVLGELKNILTNNIEEINLDEKDYLYIINGKDDKIEKRLFYRDVLPPKSSQKNVSYRLAFKDVTEQEGDFMLLPLNLPIKSPNNKKLITIYYSIESYSDVISKINVFEGDYKYLAYNVAKYFEEKQTYPKKIIVHNTDISLALRKMLKSYIKVVSFPVNETQLEIATTISAFVLGANFDFFQEKGYLTLDMVKNSLDEFMETKNEFASLTKKANFENKSQEEIESFMIDLIMSHPEIKEKNERNQDYILKGSEAVTCYFPFFASFQDEFKYLNNDENESEIPDVEPIDTTNLVS